MAEHDVDARHPASPIRLQQARKDGDAVRSQELAVAVQLLVGTAAVYFLLHSLIANVSNLATEFWSGRYLQESLSIDGCHGLARDNLFALLKVFLPLLAIIFVVAVSSHLLQSGATPISAKPLVQLRNLNPATGLARIFSLRSLSRGFLGIPKIVIVAIATFSVAWNQRNEIAQLQLTSVESLATSLTDCLFTILLTTAVSMFLLSGVDYLIERFSFHRRNQMTDQQLRDENRMNGPDPQVANRRQGFFQG